MTQKHTLRVLSIDFDLFQNVDTEIITTYYPDGVDLPTGLSSLVWRTRYVTPSTAKRIKSVTVNTDMIKELKDIILKSITHILPNVMICNSHKHIYDFIHSKMDDSDYDAINIDHLDMHHDMFSDNQDSLDCGNWLSFIKEEMNTNVTWIANPISKEVYGLDGKEFDVVRTDLKGIQNHTWDMIFLCRSDNWLPPHLDGYFEEFAAFLVENGFPCKIEQNISKSRWTKEYQKSIKDMKKELMSFF